MDANKSPQEFPYKTYLNILHEPVELIDVQKFADACTRQMLPKSKEQTVEKWHLRSL
jgi:hypothetical protein